MLYMLPYSQWKSWRERIRHFTPAWYAVIMGTGVVSALINNFPYATGSHGLQVAAVVFLILNLILFVVISTYTIARYIMFPEAWSLMLGHRSQSLFIGCIPMSVVTLIDASLAANQKWGTGGTALLYVIWGFWWLDSLLSYIIAFGMIFYMMVRQDHSISNMAALWLLPVVTLIVASSAGGLLSDALRPHSATYALVTTAFSFTMVANGLSLALMMITVYLLRLIIRGLPDPSLILSAFIVLGPLGQGGFSLLVNGQALSELLPLHNYGRFPEAPLAGQMIYAGCFCAAYLLWSMGIGWILVACCSIFHVLRRNKVKFSLSFWGLVFPNGVFALLSVQLSKVLDSPFFRVFGALWSAAVFLLWLCIFVRSIPSVIDGSMIESPCVTEAQAIVPIFSPAAVSDAEFASAFVAPGLKSQ
ncbi:voltage-dependent anion channel [Amylocystis lapponica]|nr:voltage-dependent anion channel [Amylocystis lapponica]